VTVRRSVLHRSHGDARRRGSFHLRASDPQLDKILINPSAFAFASAQTGNVGHSKPDRSTRSGPMPGINDKRSSVPAGRSLPDAGKHERPASNEEAIWLYDGLCGFCSWSVRFLLAHESAPSSRFVALQSKLGRELARQHGIDPDEPSSFLFIQGARAFEKSDGLIALAEHLRWPWRATKWLQLLPKPWRDFLYDVLARNRFRIMGRKDACELPPPHVRTRFVLPE